MPSRTCYFFVLLIGLFCSARRHEIRAEVPLLSCQNSAKDSAQNSAKNHEIRGYDFSDKAVQVFDLPKDLTEASGLAFTEDSRLFAHNDEAGMIFEIDPQTGRMLRKFYLGRPMLRGDFEGLAAKKDTLFLTNSSGTIFRFCAGADGQQITYDTFKTALHVRNDVEGLAYDPDTDGLLLACKGDAGTGRRDQKAVYSFSLKTYKLEAKPRFVLPLSEILTQTGRKEFNPSGLERHPGSGNFFLIAFNGFAIVEIDPQGKILGVSNLPKSVHNQPEGLAIAKDGAIYIANEGQGKSGKLAVYRPQK